MDDLLQLEKRYTFKNFRNEQAFEFGLYVLKLIEEKKLKNVRIRVKYNDDIAFQYLMNDKKGEMWLDRKERTVMKSGHSSLYVFYHIKDYNYMKDNKEYAVCGGGFPLIENGEVRGVFCVSGLKDTEDHQLIIDALERMKKS